MENASSSNQSSSRGIPSPDSSIPFTNNNTPETTSIQTAIHKSCTCGKEDCPSCSPERDRIFSHSYVYAIGKVVHRFPNRSLEMELAQVTGRKPQEDTKGRTREEVLHNVLTEPANRYIARQICYVLTIEGLEIYILVPNDPLDYDRMAQALRPAPAPGDVDVIIGIKGPIATPDVCNGLMVPIIRVDQIYSFDRETLMGAIPKRKGTREDQFRKTADTVFNHIIQITDNAGTTDEHRAINYLAVRYDEIYHRTQLMQDENYSFTAIEVHLSPLSGTRKIVDVVFSYENRVNRATQKWFARVDVTEEFPFLVSPLQQYIDH